MIKLIVVGALVVFLVARYRARAAALADEAAPVDLPAAATEAPAKGGGMSRRGKKASEKSPSTRLQRVRPRMRVPIPDGVEKVDPIADAEAIDAPATMAADVDAEAIATSELTAHHADRDTANTLDAIVPASGWPVSFKDAAADDSTGDTDELDIAEPSIAGADAGWAEIDMNEVGMDDALVTMPSTPPAQEWSEDDGFDPASGWSDDPSATDTSWSSAGSGQPPHDDAEWDADDAAHAPSESDSPSWDMLHDAAWQSDEPDAETAPDADQEPSWDVSDWATPEAETAAPAPVEAFDTSEPTQDIPLIASAIDDGLPTMATEPAAANDADAHGADAAVANVPSDDAVEHAPSPEMEAAQVADEETEAIEALPTLELPVEVEAPIPTPPAVEPVDEPALEMVVAEPVHEPIVDEPAAELAEDASDTTESFESSDADAPVVEAPVALEPTPLAPFVELPVDDDFAIGHFDDVPPAPLDVPAMSVEANQVTWEVEEPDPLAPGPISQEWVEAAAEMESNAPVRHLRPESADPTAPVIMYLQSGDQEMKVVIERDHTGNPLAWVLSGVAKVDAEGSAIRVRIPAPDVDEEVAPIEVDGQADVEADVVDVVAADEPPSETFDVVVEVHAADDAVAATDEPQAEHVDEVVAAVVDDTPAVAPVAGIVDAIPAQDIADEPDTAGLGALAFDEQGLSPVERESEAPVPAEPAVAIQPEPIVVEPVVIEPVVIEQVVAPPAPAPMDPIVVALLDRLADTERALVELSTRSADGNFVESKPSSKKPKRKQARKRARAGASAQMHGEFTDDVPDMTPGEESRSKGDSRAQARAARPAPGTAARPILAEPRIAERDTDAPAPRDTRPRPKKRDDGSRPYRETVDTRSMPKPMPVMVDADNPLDIAALVQAEANRRVAEVLAQHGSVKTNGDFSGLVDRLEHVMDDDSRSKA